MPNLRVVSDNAIDRAATLRVSSQASTSMSVGNLLIDRKSNVWRGVSKAEYMATTWTSPELIGCVALPFCNLSPVATMRVRLTNEAQATNLLVSPNAFNNSSAWASGSIASITTGIAGPDGTNSASVLSATGSGASFYQNVGASAGNYVSSIWIRRRAGTGAISIRNAANTSWVVLPVTSSWLRFNNNGGATGGGAMLSLQIATAGDAIEVAFAQVESGLTPTSYYSGTRSLGYIDSWQSYSYDSGAVLCCPEPSVELRGFTTAQAASAYAYGGGALARVWLSNMLAFGLRVDISDVNNAQGYIEAARLVVGPYWETTYNPSGVTVTTVDSATLSRSEGGDQICDPGTIYNKLAITLSMMPAADRAPFVNLLRNSKLYPILVSVFPQSGDSALERDTCVYGRRSKDSDIAIQYGFAYTSSLEIESI